MVNGAGFKWNTEQISPNGVFGNANGWSAAIDEELFDAQAELMATMIREASA